MATIYLETSFISACVSRRQDVKSAYRRQTSLEWWETERARHELYISAEVLDELSDPRHKQREKAIDFVRDVPLLDIDEEVRGVAEILVRERVMPSPAGGDAVHVAIAAVHEIAYIITWNVQHLANPNKMEHLQMVCRRIGMIAPQIVTPELLWETS